MTPQAASEAPAANKGALQRIVGVFTSPTETFADIGARPTFVIPIILLIVLQLAFMVLVSQRVGWERITRAQIEKSSQYQNMTPEQVEQGVRMGAKFASVVGYAGVVVGVPVVMLAVAGVLLGTVTMMGGRLVFRQSLGVTAHASMIGIVTVVLSMVVMFLKPPEDFDIQNPLAFNLGAFLSPDSSKALLAFAGSIDILSFWSIAIYAIGYSVVAKVKFSKALTAVLIPWAVYVIGKVGWAALRG